MIFQLVHCITVQWFVSPYICQASALGILAATHTQKKVRNGCYFISLPFTGSYSMCVNTLLFCVGMWLWEAASHWNRSKVVGKMAKGWINNNIVRRSCCVYHASTGVDHNSYEVRPEEEEWWKDSCYNTWTPHRTHWHHTCICTYKYTHTLVNRIC